MQILPLPAICCCTNPLPLFLLFLPFQGRIPTRMTPISSRRGMTTSRTTRGGCCPWTPIQMTGNRCPWVVRLMWSPRRSRTRRYTSRNASPQSSGMNAVLWTASTSRSPLLLLISFPPPPLLSSSSDYLLFPSGAQLRHQHQNQRGEPFLVVDASRHE